MCHYSKIDEHDRLETVIELLHSASLQRDEPVDLYRLHQHLTTTDEPIDFVAEANGEGELVLEDDDNGEASDDEMEDLELEEDDDDGDEDERMTEDEGLNTIGEKDEIDEFLSSGWPSYSPAGDDDMGAGSDGTATDNDDSEEKNSAIVAQGGGASLQDNASAFASAFASASTAAPQPSPFSLALRRPQFLGWRWAFQAAIRAREERANEQSRTHHFTAEISK